MLAAWARRVPRLSPPYACSGEPPSLIDATLDKIEGLLSAIGTGYIRAGAGYAGYPFT
jgi:hypothetical protein